MNLEVLLKRVAEVEQSIVLMANQYQTLIGHKNELQYWIEQLKNQPAVDENKVEDTGAVED